MRPRPLPKPVLPRAVIRCKECAEDATHGVHWHRQFLRWYAADSAKLYAIKLGITAAWCHWHATVQARLRTAKVEKNAIDQTNSPSLSE